MEDDRGDDDRTLGDDVRLSQRLAALYAVTARLTSSASVNEVLVEVARGVGQAIPRVGEVSIAVWDPRRGVIRDVLEFRTWTNRRVPLPPPGVHSVAGLPELVALLAGETGFVQSLVDDPAVSEAQREYMRRWGWMTLLQVPLIAVGRTLGVVEIVDPIHVAAFTDDEIRFCEAIAATGAGALRQAHLYQRVRRLADQDALTGLANPRTFRRRLAAGLRAATRAQEPVSILVIDIDDFKLLNDSRGHAHGDRVLRTCARLLRRHAREADTAGRLGGDELALAARDTGAAQAAVLSARLLAAFRREGIGVSIGVATSPTHGHTAEELINAADTALLDAKGRGKHRFSVAA
ncbi:MAG TPA: sensor domain-containing diguanylate cyclase [Gaiellales bacterium]